MSKGIQVKKRNGRLQELNINKINRCAERACAEIENVSASEVVLDAHVQLYDKIPTAEIDKALIMSARQKIEKEPNYAYVASRLLLFTIHKEVFGESRDKDAFEHQYRLSFIRNTKRLTKETILDNKLLDFDLKKLSEALVLERDFKFKYLGLQTLYDRYFHHIDGRRMETPQAFWMRVSMGLALNEKNKEQKGLLKKACQMAPIGSTVVYSTCTFAPEENENVVSTILNEENMKLKKITIDGMKLGKGITNWKKTEYDKEIENCARIWPHHNDTDGFFIARMEKC